MLWFIVLLYSGLTLIWVRWRVWAIFFWPLHLIVSDEDPRAKRPMTFRTFAAREIPSRIVVPFSIFGPCFIPISALCWVYVGMMFGLIRFWLKLRGTSSPHETLRPPKKHQTLSHVP